jgi:hypothetical protein
MRTLALTLLAAAGAAQAHPGHGLEGAHWHASDALGYLLLAAIAGVSLWWAGRK